MPFDLRSRRQLTPVSLARFTVLLCRNAENDGDSQIADTVMALPMDQIPAFMTESSVDPLRAR